MNDVIAFLTKTFAREFYRQNSGFFLLIGTLTFGFMSGVEHKALAQFFVSSPYTLMIPIGVWIIYTLKIINYNGHHLTDEENKIAFNMAFLPLNQQFQYTFICFFLEFLPALVYGVFLIGMAVRYAITYQIILVIISALAGCCAIGTFFIIRNFRNPSREKRISCLKNVIDKRLNKPLLQYYIEWILRRDALVVAATKVFAGALIFGVCKLYSTGNYDWRFITMALTGCAMANVLILFRLQEFEHRHFSWIKNLPIAISKKFLVLITAIAVFLIPECVVMLRYFPDGLGYHWALISVFYYLSLCAFVFFGQMHTRPWPLEDLVKRSFWIFIVLIILILFKAQVVMISILNFLCGYLLYRRNYYLF